MRRVRMFGNEIFKLYRSKTVRVVVLCVLLVSVLLSFDRYTRHPPLYTMVEYGYGAVVWYYRQVGTMLLVFFAAMVSEMTTQEIQRGTIRNVLSRGIKRREYWFVKLTCYLGGSALISLFGALSFMAGRTMAAGFNPFKVHYPDYLLSTCAYAAGETILSYMSGLMVFCIGFLSRSTAVTSLSGTVLVLIDGFTLNRGSSEGAVFLSMPMKAGITMYEEFFLKRRLLTADYVRYLIPYVCVDLILIWLSWMIFRRRDV